MKVKVTKEAVSVTEYRCVNEGEVGVNSCTFDLPDCFDGLCVTAVFNNIPVPVNENVCVIPSLKNGTVRFGVYAYKEDENKITLMYSPKPTCFYVDEGSYSEEIGVEDTPTLTQYEQYCRSFSNEIIKKTSLDGTEKTQNKITEITEESTDSEYPTAKAVYTLSLQAGAFGSGVTPAQKQTLTDIVNAIGLFNTSQGEQLLKNFNNAWSVSEPIRAVSITLDKSAITFLSEDSLTLTATVMPVNTTDVVVWQSSDTSIATVKNGVVTPVADGEAVITATAGNVSQTCKVKVNMYGDIENPVYMYSGYIDSSSTSTSVPVDSDTYPYAIAISAIPVSKGSIFTTTCNAALSISQNYNRWRFYDKSGAYSKDLYSNATYDYTSVVVDADGYIRFAMLDVTKVQDSKSPFPSITVTNGDEVTQYTVIDKR